jgi:hypothetical protein
VVIPWQRRLNCDQEETAAATLPLMEESVDQKTCGDDGARAVVEGEQADIETKNSSSW